MKDVPVVLVCYKRPWHTEQVLKSLKEHCIQNLYIFSDAPKTEKDIEGVEKTRRLIQSVRWTKPEIICQKVNQGLAKSIVGAANYVFRSHDRLILLEDDCVPRKYYFDFIRRCLSKYEDEEKIFGINGYTVPIPDNLLENHPFDIYFYPRIGSWGWATWKRAWKHYNTDLEKLHNQVIANNIDINQGGPDIPGMVQRFITGKLKDVWTLNWVLAVYLKNGYYIYPTASQIQNIGCDGTGVYSGTSHHFDNFCDDKEIKRLPDNVIVNQDLIDNYNIFFGQPKRKPKVLGIQNTHHSNGVKISNTQHSRNMHRDRDKLMMVADYWSEVDCDASDRNFYCFPPIRARSCKLIFGEYDASRRDWCEYWTVEKYLKDKIPFDKCLSICCGTGPIERRLSRLNLAKKIVGTDIAPGAVEKAKQRAKDENLHNIEYYVADMNNERFTEEEYDIIWANGALHHIRDLDRVVETLYSSLKPGGYLISNEYVGPRYQQIPERQQEIINAVRHLIPLELRPESEKYQYDIYGKAWEMKPIEYYLKTDPSECINSNNIVPALRKYFDEVEVKYFDGSIIMYALGSKFYNNFDLNNQKHRRLLEMLFNIEDTLIEAGEIPRDNAHIICRKKAATFAVPKRNMEQCAFNCDMNPISGSLKTPSALLYHRVESMRKNTGKLSIVHINTHDIAGGAAKVAWRLAEAQRNAGHDSRMLVGYKKSDSEHSFLFPAEAGPSARAQCRNEGQLFYEFQGSHKLINNPLVRSADILHLHNLHGGYFNPFSISALSHLKPVVWTLQDMQSITGHCAHSFDCQKWQSGCRQCPYLDIEPAIQIDTSMQLLSDKKLIYDHSYLWLVTPSQWLKSKVEKSILQGHPVELIYNGVDTTVFKPCDKKEARKKFGIAENVLVIGAVAHGGALTNQWKGGNYTQAVLDALGSKFPDYVFVNIGGNFKTDEPRIVNIPHVDNESELARISSALDVFMYTPMADTCPLVVIEAMSCSIPIVSFATGGIPELVRNGMDGYVTEYKNVPQIVKAVERLATNPLLRTEFGRNARERATSKFDLQIISTQYEHLYQRVLEESKTRSREVKLFPMTKIPKVVMTKAFEEAEKCKADLLGPEARQFTQSPGCSHTKYDVSIVIATNDRPQLLDQMLTSLKQAMLGISAEVIVIEGDCSDNTRQVLEKHNITNVYNEAECLGLGRHSWPQLYNFGFSKARGKWAMFAGDDIVFGKGCICHAVELLNKQKNGIAGGIFFYKNLNAEPGWDKFGVDFTLGSKLLMNYGLVRLDLFREVAGLDERYRFCCADGDLCYKLYQTGKQFIPVPGFVIHNNVLDVRKEANTYQSDSDIELYLQRWRHFVPVEKLKPMRLLWQEDFAEAFNVPVGLEKINSGIEHFWRGLACFQQSLFENAKIEFLQAVRLACDHWQVLWYLAKAAYECGDEKIAQRAANAVAELVPDFAEAKILVARLETNIAVDQLPEGIHYGLDAGS